MNTLKIQEASFDLSKDNSNKFYIELIRIVLIFFIIYDIEFSFLPYFTSARISFLVLFFLTINKVRFDNNFYWGSVVFFLVFIYSLFQTYFSSEPTQSLRVFWFILYGWILPNLMFFYLDKYDSFFKYLFISVSIQSLLVIVMFFNFELRNQVLQVINLATNITDEETLQRAFGFTSLTGASFSIVQSVGFFSGIYLLKENVTKFTTSLKVIYWIGLLSILVSTFLIGRTGMIMSLLFMGYYFLFVSGLKGKLFVLLLAFLLYQLDIAKFFTSATETVAGFNPDWFIEWIKDGFVLKNNSTVEYLSTMYVPPLSNETIIGIGRVESENGMGNASLNDSGYIQTYYSLGLLMSLVFYASYFSLSLDRWFAGRRDRLVFLLLIITFIIEYKEPFIFKYSLPFILSTILLYETKKS